MFYAELIIPTLSIHHVSQMYLSQERVICDLRVCFGLESTSTNMTKERGNYRIRVYLSFIQHKSPKIECNPRVTNC